MGDPFMEDLPRELRELVERETLRELVRAGLLRDPPPLYPGAETVKLARNGEEVVGECIPERTGVAPEGD
jgi:hypothetical protein